MDRIRHVFGRHDHETPNLTSESEKRDITKQLLDQRMRFERMGIEFDTRTRKQNTKGRT